LARLRDIREFNRTGTFRDASSGFDRDVQRCAEGVVVNYVKTKKAGNGVQRYNLNIRNLKEVPYVYPPRVNYSGVAIS
jgi:hypothetical protein